MTRNVRALLLSAGLGTRLRPRTIKEPKCLVPIAGEPLLARWLKALNDFGCQNSLVNTHYLAEQVHAFLENWSSSTMHVDYVYEKNLLGTAGTLLANKKFFESSTGFLIHADNATNFDLQSFFKAHQLRNKDCLLTMLTFSTDTPSSCGIVQTDSNGVVNAFYEKVMNPPGNCANGAVYLFDPPFLDWLEKLTPLPSDFSKDVLPKLLGRIQTWHTTSTFMDIGTPENLEKAQKLFFKLDRDS